ncbi:MAG: hypothetical protein HY332_21510 [Chloroflexi bacterium]|nr:hypothetical protein [Chloroflexota bacterium]
MSAGRPRELVQGPEYWIALSAQTWLSTDRFDLDQFGRDNPAPALAEIRCPVLVLSGTNEASVCLPEDLDLIARHAARAARVEIHLIEGADHFYTGHEPLVAEC